MRSQRERWRIAASGWDRLPERKRQLDLWLTSRVRPSFFATGLRDQRQTFHQRLGTAPNEVACDTLTKERFPHTVSWCITPGLWGEGRYNVGRRLGRNKFVE
ncbi:hypothetical protein MPLA_310002 [Mesorhizobium sp. ORS 3359]|nr:hypothetical protein MPLA_310002 [Mesorhizobium sp. ORS 3359]